MPIKFLGKKSSFSSISYFPFFPHAQPLAAASLLFVSMAFPILDISYNRIVPYAGSYIWLHLLSIYFPGIFIHVSVLQSFTEQSTTDCVVYHVWFTWSSFHGHLCCFHFSGVLNSVAIHTRVPHFMGHTLDIYLGVDLGGHWATQLNFFLRKGQTALQSGHTILQSTSNVGVFQFLHTLASICYCPSFWL